MKLYNFLNESIPYSKSTQKDLDDRIWAADEKRKRKLKKDPPKNPPKGTTESYYSEDPKPEQDIVDKFAGVSDKLRSYYIMKWAEEKGIDSDDAMFKAGYVQDGYIGAGAWNWRYVGMDESVQEVADNEVDGAPDYNPARGGYTNNMIGEPDERQAEKANRGPAPDKEIIMKVLPRLHDDYVKSGKYNAMELPGILRQMYPELGKREAAGYTAEFFKTFEESVMHEGQKGEGEVAKMLSKALGDENRWTEMSPYELFAELESQNPEVADMLAKVAKQLYDVKLKERTYKDVGVADVQKDPRGKEFKFDKDSKQFKSQDGELAAINTKVGKDLMKKRKSAMRKSTPSAHKKKAPNRPSLISQIFGK